MTDSGGKALAATFMLTILVSCLALQAQPAPSDEGVFFFGAAITVQDFRGSGSGSVVLHWTAPGDDGDIGRAAGYDLRYLPASFGPINTEEKWTQAFEAANEAVPSSAGQRDSAVVSGLLPCADYYFCIKSYDEAFNYSPLSNSPLVSAECTPIVFVVGDVDNSGGLDSLDLVLFIKSLKGKARIPLPLERADVNGRPGVDGTDVVYLGAYLNGGPAPVIQIRLDKTILTNPAPKYGRGK